MKRVVIAGLAAAFAAGAASAESAVTATLPNVAIPFAANGGIKSWRSGGPDAILLEARSGRWYRGEFRGACPQVRASETVGYSTNVGGALDRFSKVYVRDRVCRLRSLTAAENPRRTRGAAQPPTAVAPHAPDRVASS